MLDIETKRRIDTARDILVGKVPDPKSQVEQITIALTYKFMDDMDHESLELGGNASFFTGEYEKFGWSRIFDPRHGGHEMLGLYSDAITRMSQNPNIPQLFRNIFKNAFLPYRDPETLKLFLKTINEFTYAQNGHLGDTFEYLLLVLGSQGDAGQFLTPRHIIDFIVEVVDPKKNEIILDPACGTAGFLISAYKHILKNNQGDNALTPDERNNLLTNFKGYDISPDMVRLSLVNLFLHGFVQPLIYEYDTLTSEERWDDYADVILANPPFMSPKGGIRPHKRFSVQSNRSEVLFVDYIAEHLTLTGRAGVIVPEGIIFQSAGAYKRLRKYLVDQNYLWAVASLPAGVFHPYSGVKTSILFMDKSLAKKTTEILFIKVDNDGFDLGAQRRPTEKSDLPSALRILNEYKQTLEINKSTKTLAVNKYRLSGNDYNLNIDRYQEVIITGKQTYPLVPLGNLCDFINGKAFKPEDWEKINRDGLPIIRIQNLNDQNAKYNYYSKPVDDKYYVNKGDLLFSWSGSKGTSFGAHIWNNSKGVLNQHIFRVIFDSTVIKEYLLIALNKAVEEVEQNLHGGVGLVHITKGNLEKINIPLPPMEVQHKIVEEIASYQRIIDGARQVVEGWKPDIELDKQLLKGENVIKIVKLGDICTFEYGKPLKSDNRVQGDYPVFGSNGIVGYHNSYLVEAPFIIVGRKGSAGEVHYSEKNGYPIDTTFFIKLKNENRITLKYLFYVLKSLNLRSVNTQAGVPGLNRNDAYKIDISLPPLEYQNEITALIEHVRDIVEGNRELIQFYEKKIEKVIEQVWEE